MLTVDYLFFGATPKATEIKDVEINHALIGHITRQQVSRRNEKGAEKKTCSFITHWVF